LESLDPKNDKMETCGFSGEGILSRERDAVPTMVLGTAQLGLDYGVSNKTGKPRPEEAPGAVRMDRIRVPHGPDVEDNGIEYGRRLEEVIVVVDIDEQTLSEVISDFKKESRFKYFGISVYSPGYALRALRIDGIDFVQIPYNVFDQRAERHGVFDLASKRGKQVFVRSIYLQGLLLMDPTELGEAWVFSKVPLKTFAQCASSIGVSRKLLALAFVAQTAPQAMLVIGAETPDQVSENLDMLKEAERVSIPEIAQLSSNDPMLINPSLWQQ